MVDFFEYDVFLSFASSDEEIAKPVWQELSLSGLRVFWSDSSLKKEVGNSWFQVVQNSLERSRHMLLICTASSMRSKYVQLEYQSFIDACYKPGVRRLIPVLTKEFRERDLPIFLKQFEAVNNDDPNIMQEIIPLLGGVSIEKLKSENQHLRAQIDLLRFENESLKNKNDELRKLLKQEKKRSIISAYNAVHVSFSQKVSSLRIKVRNLFLQYKRTWLIATRNVILIMFMAVSIWGFSRSKILTPVLEPSIRIVNDIENSASIFINDRYYGIIDAHTSAFFYPDELPAKVSYTVVKSTMTNGRYIGDEMKGSWASVTRWETLHIDSTIDEDSYFYLIVTNKLNTDCSVILNEGMNSENSPGAVVESSKSVELGYYKLFKNSNVVLSCDDGTIYWWGERDNQVQGTPLYQLAERTTGILRLTLK